MLKSVILSLPAHTGATTDALPDPQRLVARLAKGLDSVTNSKARASIYWLVGQYAAAGDNKGLGWDGVASWVPDVLRRGVKAFADEVSWRPQAAVSKLTSSLHSPSCRSSRSLRKRLPSRLAPRSYACSPNTCSLWPAMTRTTMSAIVPDSCML